MQGRDPFLEEDRERNQEETDNERGGMKTQEAAHGSCFANIVRNAVREQPVFAQPDIEEKDHHKSAQIEDVLFDRDGLSQGGGGNSECRAAVGKTEEPAGGDKVEQEAN